MPKELKKVTYSDDKNTMTTLEYVIDELEGVLNQETATCDKLLQSCQQKLDAIVHVDMEGIDEATANETVFSSELTALTAKRQTITRELAITLGVDAYDKLGELIPHIPSKPKQQIIVRARQSLMNVGMQVKKINHSNKDILKAGLERTRGFFKILGRAESDSQTYTKSGEMSRTSLSVFSSQA